MTITHDTEEINQEIARRVLGLKPTRGYLWNGQELLQACPECGHHPAFTPPPPYDAGPPTEDVVQDRAALRQAAQTVAMLVEVLDRRRPVRQVRDRVDARVIRYLDAVANNEHHASARLLTLHSTQPHEGAVEVAATIRLGGRRRALAASFELANDWRCETIRIL